MTTPKLSVATLALSAALTLGAASHAEAGGYGRKSYGYGPSSYSGYGYAPYRKHRSNRGAVVAGAIGALALGAIAGQGLGQVPSYGYGSGAEPAYGAPSYGYGYPRCEVVLRRVMDSFGNVGTIREKVCQ